MLVIMSTTADRISGRDLRLLRLAHEVQLAALARAWGCSRQNIARVESARRPTETAISRYVAALQLAEGAEA